MRARKMYPVAILALGTVLVAACGGDDGSNGSDQGSASDGTSSDDGAVTGSVTMWTYPVIADEATHRGYWDDTIAAFNEEYPDVDVTVEIFPWKDRDQALSTAIAGNSAPDVVYLIPDQLPAYAGSIEPLGSYLGDEAKADYRQNVIDAVTIDGQLMGAPLLASAVPLTCNKAVFDDVGQSDYPATWDDLQAMAPEFDAAGYDMIAYRGDVGQTLNLTFYPLLWQAGGEVFSEDGSEVAFDSPEGLRALEFLQQMVEAGYVAEDQLTSDPPIEQTKVARGEVGCVWYFEPMHLVEFWGEENTVVLPPLSDAEQVAYGTVGSLTMLSSSEDKEAAGAWISFVTDAEQAAEYDKASGFLPVKESVGSLYGDDPIQGEVEKHAGFTTVGPLHESAREVMGVLAPEIQAVLIGEKDPQQALDDAAEAAQPLLQ